MILASSIMNISEDAFVKTFEISIQIGAILAVLFLYFKRFLTGISIYLKLGIAFIPTGIIGFLAYHFIKTYLFNPIIVSVSLILGGIVLILIDKRVAIQGSNTDTLENISYKHAFFIGLFQSVSVIPGVSRAAATIAGGIFNGLDRRQAVEFSFLLAVPTMFVATFYDLFKNRNDMIIDDYSLLAVGFVTAFVVAFFTVKAVINFLTTHTFIVFGIYRIIFGILLLVVL